MNPISFDWPESAFHSVAHATWQGAGLALVVLAMTRCLGERVRANWRFLLWLVVFARLAMPWIPAAPWSVYAFLPNFEKRNAEIAAVAGGPLQAILDPLSSPRSPEAAGHDPASESQSTSTQTIRGSGSRFIELSASICRISLSQWLTIGWLAGMALLAGRIIRQHVCLARYRTFWRSHSDPVLYALFEQCRAEARLRRPVNMRISSDDIGPATCGVLVPTIVLPERLATSLSRDELRLVLLHELIHVRRRDAAIDLVAAGIACIHWFNPAAWLALASLRRERELACDAALLELLGTSARMDYGSVLLKTVETLAAPATLAGAVAMFETRFFSDSLAGRIQMIANYRRMTRTAHSFGGMLLITLALFGLTDAGAADGEKLRGYAESRDNSGLIGAPVMYRNTMLIVVTDEGVAAIAFREKDPKLINASAKYRFRFLKDAKSDEISGTGIVLDSVGDIEERTIKAGPIRVGWSGGSHDRGWIYYQPEDMQICIAAADRFEDSIVHPGPGENRPMQKLDLKRYLRKRN
jgi:bla regulator protein BlaR1